MEWLFEGLGTFLIGLVLGVGGGSAVTWRLTTKKLRQSQRARDDATQIQIAGDLNGPAR